MSARILGCLTDGVESPEITVTRLTASCELPVASCELPGGRSRQPATGNRQPATGNYRSISRLAKRKAPTAFGSLLRVFSLT